MTKFDNAYYALHWWVRYHKPKSKVCENCGLNVRRLELANFSGEYKRDIDDYNWLCAACHRCIDGIHHKQSVAADKRRAICQNGHDQRITGYYRRARVNKPGWITRACKLCALEAQRRYAIKKKLSKEE